MTENCLAVNTGAGCNKKYAFVRDKDDDEQATYKLLHEMNMHLHVMLCHFFVSLCFLRSNDKSLEKGDKLG